MAVQPVRFPGHHSDVTLAGLLHTPDEKVAHAWVLFAHCFTCSKNSKAAASIARALTRAGLAVLRFDFTGLGDSEGAFERSNFSSNIDDLIAAAHWLETHHSAPSILVGHSLGGAASIAAAHELSSVRAVVTLASPFDPSEITRHFEDQVDEIAADGKATVILAGRPFTITQQFVEDLRAQNQKERVRTLARPLLILHSPTDKTVNIRNATSYFTAAMHPKSFVSLDSADHLLTRKEDAEFAANLIAAFAQRYAPSL